MIPSVSLLPELAAVFSIAYERSHSIEDALASRGVRSARIEPACAPLETVHVEPARAAL